MSNLGKKKRELLIVQLSRSPFNNKPVVKLGDVSENIILLFYENIM